MLPLHATKQVLAEWKLLDCLSGGRVGMSIASGWVPDDFVLAPGSFEDRGEIMFDKLAEMTDNWKRAEDGDQSCSRRRGELPVWITINRNHENFRRAGELGYNVLTALLGQTIAQLEESIAIYRDAREQAGHIREAGQVAVMVHTYLAETVDAALTDAAPAFAAYLESHALLRQIALSDRTELGKVISGNVGSILPAIVDRYIKSAALIGDINSCRQIVSDLEAAGVNEIACLVDFGVPHEKALNGVARIAKLSAQTKSNIRTDELTRWLGDRLPGYMVPNEIVVVPGFPLTPSGKVDRVGLAASYAFEDAASDFRAPLETWLELEIADIWSRCLKCGNLSGSDNFFALGGHSLLASQALWAINDRLGSSIPLSAIFEAETLTDFAALIETNWLDRAQSIVKRSADAPSALEMSFSQERMWFLEHFDSIAGLYTDCTARLIEGDLDEGVLHRAIGEIVDRHEVLRTVYVEVDGEFRQEIGEDRRFEYVTHALDAGEDWEAALGAFLTGTIQRPFDLERGPLLRVAVVRLSARRHVLVVTMHHIVSDGWSLGIFVREFTALYAAFAAGWPSPLAPLPIQYADFALWQRETLSGAKLERLLAYWRGALDGLAPALLLPTDHPRPAVQTFRGRLHMFDVPSEVLAALKAFSRQENVTLFMTLLAAFDVVLHRYSGLEDIAVGAPIANRSRAEVEALIGFFTNTLVLRSDLGGDPSFAELVGRVREMCLGAYAHQELPFEKLVEALQPNRDLSSSPMFQVMINLLSNELEAFPAAVEAGGIRLSRIEWDSGTSKFDLTLFLAETGDGLHCRIEYNADLFEPATIARFGAHFARMLELVAADPHRRIGDIDALPDAERGMLAAWNATQADYPHRSIDALFAEQAVRTPDRIAVEDERTALTYRALDEGATRLARHLGMLGIGRGGIVGLCLDRSVDMVTAMIAVLRAGAAYVPLDPGYPRDRLAFMIDDAGIAALVTSAALSNVLALRPDLPIVLIDRDRAAIDGLEGRVGASLSTPDDLAYILYTSGSTGRPKGVMIGQAALANLLFAIGAELALGDGDTLLAVTPFSFDISGLELLAPLLFGARVLIADKAATLDGERLAAQIEAAGVTVMQATPATWFLLLGIGWRPAAGLIILCGGEAMPPELAMTLTRSARRVLNMYGPTETTIWSTAYEIPRNARPDEDARPISIGRPLANTQVHVLDRHGRLAPIGAQGELLIGGDGLAKGYHLRDDLTAERFVDLEIAGGLPQRLYRTGDLARWNDDGTLEFLGRIDHQVKIRGHRIELGEIEAVCADHPAVQQAVVIPTTLAANDQRLIAFVTPEKREGDFPGDEVMDSLRLVLPGYMVPARIVPLAKFPINPSGKVDRAALAEYDFTLIDPSPRNRFIPSDETERAIADAWQSLLGLEELHGGDDFFQLGGHSLLAARLIVQLRKQLQVKISMRIIFESSDLDMFIMAIRHIVNDDGHTSHTDKSLIDNGNF